MAYYDLSHSTEFLRHSLEPITTRAILEADRGRYATASRFTLRDSVGDAFMGYSDGGE